jgi:hypothetical protein
MPITFENNNDVIIYALECIISHARRTQQIFVAQCVWWLASIIGLEQELVSNIDNLQGQENMAIREQLSREVSAIPRDLTEDQRVDQVLDYTEQYLRESNQLRKMVDLKVTGKTKTGCINPLKSSKKALRVTKEKYGKQKSYNKIEGMEVGEIDRRKAAGECLRCAWPSGKKESP